ncbi:MAG: hypothetical protein IPI23_19330 [Bacteroidetes bacterium]|nr:hypothetical protein [Bacteroidota bacterium]
MCFIGWVSAFVSSWFFELWHKDEEIDKKEPTGVLAHLLDNLRFFILEYKWWSVLILASYILAILFLSHICYWLSIKAGFIKHKDNYNKLNNDEEKDKIEFNTDSQYLFKTQFRAGNMYEMWLKMAPFLFPFFPNCNSCFRILCK